MFKGDVGLLPEIPELVAVVDIVPTDVGEGDGGGILAECYGALERQA